MIVTGALVACHTPLWINWLREERSDLSVRLVLTPAAAGFVSEAALNALSPSPVVRDVWSSNGSALHVELSRWADAAVVYPCTMRYLARFALGLTETPSLLALEAFSGPVAVAPALPPGVGDGAAYAAHTAALATRPNVTVVPPVPVRSSTTGRYDAAGPPSLSKVLEALTLTRQ
ncbi:flavoprotein [Nocardiopsis mwathae]|uniref:flavoprotein n=1 Tax=Nocardiopsis mwathae TaxID=1472723 RepID=UPI0037449198